MGASKIKSNSASTFGSNLFVNKIADEAILPQTALDDIFNIT